MKKILIFLSIAFVVIFYMVQAGQERLENKKAKNGDLLYVDKVCVKDVCEEYHNKRFRVPTQSMFPLFKVGGKYKFRSITQFTKLNRFDVVAFKLDVNDKFPSFEIKKDCVSELNIENKCAKRELINYTKRVVGLPNDTIQMVKGRLKINGQFSKYTTVEGSDKLITLGQETLKSINGKGGFKYYIEKYNDSEHIIAMATKYKSKRSNTEPYVLGDNEYFMMGDNREFSSDSRTFGSINKKDITYLYYSELNPNNTVDYTIAQKN